MPNKSKNPARKKSEHARKKAKITASLEDYLEAIFDIIAAKGAVRARDIAARLKVKRPSVTGALQTLAEKGLINYAPYDVITLTPEGKAAAKHVVRRHEVLHDFFVKVLAVDESEAEASACKMEHVLSEPILRKLTQFVEYLEGCPRGRQDWVDRFRKYCEHGKLREPCEMCDYEARKGANAIRGRRQQKK